MKIYVRFVTAMEELQRLMMLELLRQLQPKSSHKRPPKIQRLGARLREVFAWVGPQERNFQVNLEWSGIFILKK